MKALHLAGLLLISFAVVQGKPLDVVFLLETSPGTEHALGLIDARELAEGDRAGVLAYQQQVRVLQTLTADQEKVADALQGAGMRVGAVLGGVGPREVYPQLVVDLGGALEKSVSELRPEEKDRTPVIILFFAGSDPKLNSRREALRSMLRSTGARLYVVAISRIEQPEIYPVPQLGSRRFPTTPTAVLEKQLLFRLAQESGGRAFDGGWSLRRILSHARR